jgi:uncharacterized protein (TIGR03435 family)
MNGCPDAFSRYLTLVGSAVLVSFACVAQGNQEARSPKPPVNARSAPGFTFEVFSIKPVQRGPGMSLMVHNPTPNGFTGTVSLWQLVAFAFGPPVAASKSQEWQLTEIRNQPKWLGEQAYAVQARVSQGDLKAWQSQSPTTQELFHAALRAELKNRCALALHEEPALGTIFALTVAKKGHRLKPATPPNEVPQGMRLGSGAWLTFIGGGRDGWTFHGATMEDLVSQLSILSLGTPVRDRTGLSGRYDFSLRRSAAPSNEDQLGSVAIEELGLQLSPGKENRPALVIDHIERPTSN